ncbi:uncharacterized protein LOC114534115 [Dendronephthya gigantea]|uniref:uncharacterized protein LOC114534115 n=1 Tax=Dendronephthya gigantea TaxID=151771 RepID=UPI00106D8AE7|nr:uncharacterized protein LOC114534115 [Dendronephthya gigantea]
MATEYAYQKQTIEELMFAKPKPMIERIGRDSRVLSWSTTTKVTITVLTLLAVFLEHLFTFKLLRYIPLYLCTHWLTSVVSVLIFHLLAKRKSSYNFDDGAKGGLVHRIPLLIFYIITVYISETDLATQVNSQGPSAFLVNLCLSPLIVTAALTCFIQEQTASWVSALTVTYSGMMLMTVCSDDGSCYVSFKDAAFNVAFTAFYGMYIVKIAQSLHELSVGHVLLLVNTASAALVPGLIMFSREGEIISSNPSIVMELVKPSVIVPLIFLKLFEMITMLLHIKITGVTTHVLTRNLAWIPTCISIGIVGKVELMVSSFKAYWIVLGSYILYVIPDDHDTKRPR